MKLEKREITLNEKDSFSDMAFFEESLKQAYETHSVTPLRKETSAFLALRLKQLDEEKKLLANYLKEYTEKR